MVLSVTSPFSDWEGGDIQQFQSICETNFYTFILELMKLKFVSPS